MSELTPALIADVVAACRIGAAEAADALGRALGGKFTLAEPQEAAYAADAPPEGFDGPALAILLTVGGAGLAIVLPESAGMLPDWYAAPDLTGESKLSTLAQELSMLLIPETLAADKFEARRVASLQSALVSAGVAADASLVTIDAAAGEHAGKVSLIWPLATPTTMFVTPAAASSPREPQAAPSSSAPGGASASPTSAKPSSLVHLPNYSRSLLKIRIPVSVHLASKKESVQEVVEMVPGAIIKFEKGCDELLQMVIGGQTVAEGEAVKIGDKFGFRVTGMLMPREHFVPARRPQAG